MKFPGNLLSSATVVRALGARVRDLFTSPAAAWKHIATERMDVAGVYLRHLLPLAALALVLGLLGWAVAASAGAGGQVATMPRAISSGLVMLAMVMVGIWVLALAAEMLAPRFGARRSEWRAFSLMAHSATPLFLVSFFALVPGAVWLCLLGLGVALWLVWLGLPRMLVCPPAKQLPFFILLAAGVAIWALLTVGLVRAMQPRVLIAPPHAEVQAPLPAQTASAVAGAVTEALEMPDGDASDALAQASTDAMQDGTDGMTGLGGLGLPPLADASAASDGAASPGSPSSGPLAAGWADSLSLPPTLGADSSGGDSLFGGLPAPGLPTAPAAPAVSEASLQQLAQKVSGLLPANLAGMARDQVNVQTLAVPGMNGVAVGAGYGQGGKSIALNIVYAGPAPRQTLLGDWANSTLQREDAERSERIYAEGPRHISEVGRKDGTGANMRLLLANGVMIDADATGMPLEQLRSALAGLPLAEIEGLQPGP